MDKNEVVESYFNKTKDLTIEELKEIYSPMFNKSFDKMTDEEIRNQITFWVEKYEDVK